jgi:hypothetical protein
MSEQYTHTESDVLTGHTELISSTSIERIVVGRNAALEQIKAMIHQLADISALTESIGVKQPLTGQCVRNFAVVAGYLRKNKPP